MLARGPVQLLLTRADGPAVVVETLGTGSEPAAILVDGSVLEAFAAGVAPATRAYLSPGGGWLIEAATDEVTVSRLGH